MKKLVCICSVIAILFMLSCNSRKSSSEIYQSVIELDSMHSDTLQHSSPNEFADNHMSTPPLDDKYSDGLPSSKGKGRRLPQTDNMRGFDPASEDDMEDNGILFDMNYQEELMVQRQVLLK